MPAPSPCPVSNVDRALSSYINSREETLKIRRTLAKYLTANLRPVNASTQDQHLNHQCPQNLNATGTNPPGLKGVRSKYLDALRANHAARTRHRQLQSSMDELHRRHMVETPVETDVQYENELLLTHVDLIRQRRRFMEIQVVQDSLEKLLNANPIVGHNDPRTLVTRAIGEQPDLPAERLDQTLHSDDNGPLILKVKKEVLGASSALEHADSTRTKAKAAELGAPRLEQQVYALGCARAEMVEWVQGELAKMEEESGFVEDASPIKRTPESASALDLNSSGSLIRSTYERYNSSRAAAVRSHESMQRTQQQKKKEPDVGGRDGPGAKDADAKLTGGPANVFTHVLPHLPGLAHIVANERALLQQAVYLQTQIGSADEDTAEHLSRLAGESHLLPSGSKSIEAWGQVAVQVERNNEKVVQDYVQDSQLQINRITAIVDLCSLHSQVLSSV